MEQLSLMPVDDDVFVMHETKPFKTQLLKWIGNKQRFAHEIIRFFPSQWNTYHEPFLGSGAVLGTLASDCAVGSDAFGPLIAIWQKMSSNPELVKEWYRIRWTQMIGGEKVAEYERIKASYNENPNPADFLFLTRSCYGGVIRFRQADGYMSTPCGPHNPVTPESFDSRVDLWADRIQGARFVNRDFEESIFEAKAGDVVYCDPPYSDSQAILYGAQAFTLGRLTKAIGDAKERGVRVLLSIDGTKKSGDHIVLHDFPTGLFENEALVNCGVSQLRRFQRGGETLEDELVSDRLLLTY